MNRAIIFIGLSVAIASASGGVDAQQTKPMASTPVKAESTGADTAFAAWDVDHDGDLSKQEFSNGWEQVRRATELQGRLRQQFGIVDINKSGAIEPVEYTSLILVKEAGKSAPPFSTFDANKDGRLQFGEYLKLVQTLAPKEAAKGNPR
jgi:Ca2+-binding EF-hand superfamily protein